jgi:hypothetical protein
VIRHAIGSANAIGAAVIRPIRPDQVQRSVVDLSVAELLKSLRFLRATIHRCGVALVTPLD